MPWFTTLDQQRIAGEIADAQSRVILAAPGLWLPVADALIDAQERLGEDNIVVVVDASADVARLGLGEFEAIAKLRGAGIEVRQHSGLRLGVLICDHHGWGFAMAAALVESDPTTDTDAFNAICLTGAQVDALAYELPGAGADSGERADVASDSNEPLVGAELVGEQRVADVAIQLKLAPPQDFDLARQTNVYTPWVQFVELELPGFGLRARQVELPPSLQLLATNDPQVAARISSRLRLFESSKPPRRLTEIKQGVDELRAKFLIPVGMSDRIILKRDLAEFKRRLAIFEVALVKCRDEIKEDVDKQLQAVIDALAPELAQIVFREQPLRFVSSCTENTIGAAETFVREELSSILPDGEECVENMEIRVHYKDLTYATLNDERFRQALDKKLPKELQQIPLADEFRAAGTRKPASRARVG
jgi:hypothetical protein